MKIKHRALTILLAMAMMLSFMPSMAFAEVIDTCPVKLTITKTILNDATEPLKKEETLSYSFEIDPGNSKINSVDVWMLSPNGNKFGITANQDGQDIPPLAPGETTVYKNISVQKEKTSVTLEVNPTDETGTWQLGQVLIDTADGKYAYLNKDYYPSETAAVEGAIDEDEFDNYFYDTYDVVEKSFDQYAFTYKSTEGSESSESVEKKPSTKRTEDKVSPAIKGDYKVYSKDTGTEITGESVPSRKEVCFRFKVKEDHPLRYVKVFFENGTAIYDSDKAYKYIKEYEDEDPVYETDEEGYITYECRTSFYDEGTYHIAYIEAKDLSGNVGIVKSNSSLVGDIDAPSADMGSTEIKVTKGADTGSLTVSDIGGELVELTIGTLPISVVINDSMIPEGSNEVTFTLTSEKVRDAYKTVSVDLEKDGDSYKASAVLDKFQYNGRWYLQDIRVGQNDAQGTPIFEKAYVNNKYKSEIKGDDYSEYICEVHDLGSEPIYVGKKDSKSDTDIFATGEGLAEDANVEAEIGTDRDAELLEEGSAKIASYEISISEELTDTTKIFIPVDSNKYADGTTLRIRHGLKNGIQTVDSVVKNGKVSIDVDECSPFLISTVPQEKKESSGSNSGAAVNPAPQTPQVQEVYLAELPKISAKKSSGVKRGIKFKWKKISKKKRNNITAIEVQYSPYKDFSNAATVIAGKGKASIKIKNLPKKTRYWARARVIREAGGVKYVGKWSKAKKMKTK